MVKLRKNIWYVLYANFLMSGHLIAWNGLKDLKEQTEDQKTCHKLKFCMIQKLFWMI